MKLTKKMLKDFGACREGYEWYLDQKTDDFFEICKRLKNYGRIDDLNWILPRMMTRDQAVRYAIYAAERCIKIYEQYAPDDDRPRRAIKAAKTYLRNPCRKAAAAAAAAAAAWAAAWAAAAAADAAWAAAWAAAAAADAAWAAAAAAAWAAAAAAARDADAGRKDELLRICNYGIRVLKKRN